MNLKKIFISFTTLLLTLNPALALNFDINLPENNLDFFVNPAQITLFAPDGVSYPGSINFFITSASGDRVNLPEGWEVVITNQTGENFVNQLNNTDIGIYQSFSPLIDNPPIGVDYNNGNQNDAPLMLVPAKYQLKNPAGQIISFGQFSLTYPELNYRLTTEKEHYNEGEQITVTLERKVTDFAGYREFSLPENWTIEFLDNTGAKVADTNNGINPTNNSNNAFTFNMPEQGYADDALFQVVLKNNSTITLSEIRFSESQGQIISFESKEYQLSDKIFVDIKNDDGNPVLLDEGNEIQVFYTGNPNPTLVATTEQVLVDIDTTAIKDPVNKQYLLTLPDQSGSYLAQIVKPREDAGYQVLSVDTFKRLSNTNEEDAGDENGAINDQNIPNPPQVDEPNQPQVPEVNDNQANNNQANNNQVNNGGGGGNGGGGSARNEDLQPNPQPQNINYFLPPNDNRQCTDVEDDYWAKDLLAQMLTEQTFPVELNDANQVLCRPQRTVTRKEFTAWLLSVYQPELVANIDQLDYDFTQSPLSDITGDDPYDKYIIIAFQNNIINGYPDGLFRPNQVINRAEVLKILSLTSGIFNNTDEEIASLRQSQPQFDPETLYADINNEGQYFYNYLHFASSSYSDELETFLIQGRKVNLNGKEETRAAMEEPILFSEAAKIVKISKQMKAERQIVLQ